MKQLFFWTVLLGLLFSASPAEAQKKGKKKKKKAKQEVVETPFALNSYTDSVSYAFGVVLGNNLLSEEVFDMDLDILKKGIVDVLNKDSVLLDKMIARTAVNEHIESKRAIKNQKLIKVGEDFLAANGAREEVITTESGLQYEILTAGEGAKPTLANKVVTHYKGTLLDGTQFDSSYDRGEPISFPLKTVIKGWQEALQLMPTGSKWRLYVPYSLAYGENGAPPQIPPFSALIFDIELLDIE